MAHIRAISMWLSFKFHCVNESECKKEVAIFNLWNCLDKTCVMWVRPSPQKWNELQASCTAWMKYEMKARALIAILQASKCDPCASSSRSSMLYAVYISYTPRTWLFVRAYFHSLADTLACLYNIKVAVHTKTHGCTRDGLSNCLFHGCVRYEFVRLCIQIASVCIIP